MKLFRKMAATAAAAMVVMASGSLVAQADEKAPDLYTTPGGHNVNGRDWFTNCEMYSSNVVRCNTDIWSIHVEYVNGAYQRVEGWTFNNLTYLPSSRSGWAGNNLAQKAEWTSAGRKWRTECDTAVTGRGGCRSYIWTKQAKAVPVKGSYGGTASYRFELYEGWVFNNIVMFSSNSVPAIRDIPTYALDGVALDWEGFGPLKLGVSVRSLVRLGYVTTDLRTDALAAGCEWFSNGPALKRRGLVINSFAYDLESVAREVHLTTPAKATAAGARVGMAIGEVRALYGAGFTVVTGGNYSHNRNGFYGEPFQTGRVSNGQRELVFVVDDQSSRAITDSDKITRIILKEKEADDNIFSIC